MAKKKTKSKQKTQPKAVKKSSWFFRSMKWLFLLSIWGGVVLSIVLLWFAKDLPNIIETASFDRRASIVIKASDGSEIARYGDSKGQNLNVSTLPPHLIHAVLATEDRRFYQHFGIDLFGLTRAMITNLYKMRFVQGGSTITQQLAKNIFLTQERKLQRKIKEAMLAIWLEQKLSKDEILSAYMNRVYLGSGTYGFEAAAQFYFGKSAHEVNLREAAVLAGLLKAPSRYSPHNDIKLAKQRSDLVLGAMVDAGYISETDISKQNFKLHLPNKKDSSEQTARYFADWVIQELDQIVGSPDMDIIVETTLDIGAHMYAQNRLTQAITNADELQFISQGAILVMRPDGAILTMIGGRDYSKSQFNRVTQARRQPGSAFKPIVYLSALEHGWNKQDKILDAPINNGEYRPKNFNDLYLGRVDLETALAKSLNTATVRLVQDIGIGNALQTARNLGITSPLERNLSLALGSSGVSMIEMGTAYSIFANGGFEVFPYGISRVTNTAGKTLYERKRSKTITPIIAQKNAQAISIMLQSVVNNGTGKKAKQFFPVHGKTGTSQNNRDAWFAGYTDNIVSVVWLGNDDNSPMRHVTGGGLPAEIFKDVIANTHTRHPKISFPKNTSKQQNNSFSNMLGRIFKSEPHPNHKKKNKNDFSGLNR